MKMPLGRLRELAKANQPLRRQQPDTDWKVVEWPPSQPSLEKPPVLSQQNHGLRVPCRVYFAPARCRSNRPKRPHTVNIRYFRGGKDPLAFFYPSSILNLVFFFHSFFHLKTFFSLPFPSFIEICLSRSSLLQN